MAKKKDRINARLAAIKTASTARFDAPEPPRASTNKRSSERRNVYRFGRVVLPDRSMLNCIIKDISEGGAKVVLDGAITVPPRVLLKIDQTGENKRAYVVWQKDAEIGLQFVVDEPTGQEPAPGGPAKPSTS